MGPTEETMAQKLTEAMPLDYLELINESDMHNVPPGSESHFKLTIVSKAFEGKNLLAQHRMINAILASELQQNIHALALHTYTPAQWQETQGISPDSPPCLGGGKS